MTDISKEDEFVNCFSYFSADIDDFDSEWKNINRDEEKLEIIKKKSSFDKLINKEISPLKVLIIYIVVTIVIVLMAIIVAMIQNMIQHGKPIT